jgi:hypothetical protein
MSVRIFRLMSFALLMALFGLMGQPTLPAVAGRIEVKKDQPSARPAWPSACRLALKYCRIVKTCRIEQVSDCSQNGVCKLLYKIKPVCRCRVMCRLPGRASCTIHAQCPNGS